MGNAPMKLFTIPALENFLARLADHVLEKCSSDPLRLADTHIILPTERACLALEKALTCANKGRPLIMPHIKSITGWTQPHGTSTQVVSAPQRHLLLSQLLKEKTGYSWQECFSLATSLMQLLDQCHTEEIPLEKLEALVPEELSGHWQRSLDILRVLSCEWPLRLQELGLEDPLPARAHAFKQQVEEWRKSPPQGFVIAAGLVGSVPSVALFLKEISAFASGEIIFAGLDLELKEEDWQSLPPYHPQYGLKQTLERMDCRREQIQHLPSISLIQNSPFPLSLSPPSSLLWRSRLLKNLFAIQGLHCGSLQQCLQENALESIKLIEAESLQEEARIIALIIRDGLNDPDNIIALVTPHRGLSDRVSAELKRWRIVPNDSYGESLFESSQGSFLTLSLNVALHPQNTVAMLGLLKHPLTLLGLHPAECRKMTRRLEMHYLRPLSPFEKLNLWQIEETDLASFCKTFFQAIAPLTAEPASLAEWIRRHRTTLETLAQDVKEEREEKEENRDEEENEEIKQQEQTRLWQGKNGQATFELLQRLEKISPLHQVFTLKEYAFLVSTHLKKIRLTKTYGMHPRVHILGPLEARTLHFDLAILGAMNDAHWSESAQPDPWLSYEMKQHLGLPDESYRVGLMAADWMHLLHSKRVVLTCAQRENGLTMLPSRWLMRLKAILKSNDRTFLLNPLEPWKKWAQNLDSLILKDRGQEDGQGNASCSSSGRPAPRPPVSLRPRKLSVTDVQLWAQDPYALYAKKILKLSPLPPLEKEVTPATFGIVVHRALERYIHNAPTHQTRAHLLEYGRQAFGEMLEHLMIKTLWWPRFVRLCDWFLTEEKRRLPEIMASWTEVKGHLVVDAPGGPFILTAKADRIDALKEGALEIIDYKTGELPSRKAVLNGEVLQLPLEAAITRYGSWENQNISSCPLKTLSYWHLKGGIPPGSVLRFEETEKMAEKALATLEHMILLFDKERTPYRASAQNSNLYDPLARRQEWRNK